MKMSDRLRIERLSCRFGPESTEALHDICLTVRPGEFVLLTGRSGCGKSALIRCGSGLIPRVFPGRVSGAIQLNGRPLATLRTWEIAEHVGVTFQDPDHQLFTRTIEDEAAFGPENLGLPQPEVAERVEQALRLTGLWGIRRRLTAALSFGQKRRAGIAGILALGPRLLLMDEPASVLDEESARSILGNVARIAAAHGGSVVVAEHRIGYVLEFATRLIVMQGGSIVYHGNPRAAMDGRFCARYGLRPPVGNPMGRARFVCQGAHMTDLALTARGVCFSYPDCQRSYGHRGPVLADVDLDVAASTATVIEGPNGSGKTTLLKVLAGLLQPTSGTVHRCGNNQRRSRGSGVAYVGHQPAYLFRCSQVERELDSWLAPEARQNSTAYHLTELLDLGHVLTRHPLALSEGESRRLAIAAALAAQPQVLILDEPSVGFDGYHLDCLLDALERYVAAGGALVVASNDPDLLCRMPACAIRLGAAAGGPQKIRERPQRGQSTGQHSGIPQSLESPPRLL